MRVPSSLVLRVGLFLLGGAGTAPALAAQSLTNGAMRGVVLYAEDGTPIAGVQITLEGLDGRAMRYLEADGSGRFAVPLVAPGEYRVLAEQVGLQPVRLLGVRVAAGQTTALTFRLERRPPPIDRVVEIVHPGALAGTSLGPTLLGSGVARLPRHMAATDLSRGFAVVDGPRDARDGFAVSGGGLGASASRLQVDGLGESLLRHPGVPGEPASAPLWNRGALTQVQALSLGLDTEWPGLPGATLNGHSLRGGSALSFRPYGTVSHAAIGADVKDNPADSAGTSFQMGGVLSGPIVQDTAHFMLRLDYQQLRTPAPYPWEQDESVYQGEAVSLRESLPLVAQDAFGVALQPDVSPTVRTWRGFSGLGRVDWRLGTNDVFVRFGYGKWVEEHPLLLDEPSNLRGVELTATDLSGALGVSSDFGWAANEVRVGFTTAQREWIGGSLPATSLAAEGIGFGRSAALPGIFERRALEFSNAFSVSVQQHRLKFGVSAGLLEYEQDYRFGSTGVFTFGSLDGFGAAEGIYYQTVGPAQERANPRINTVGVFAQDMWTLSPEFTFLVGVRYDREQFPENRITPNVNWFDLTGAPNDFVPTKGGVSPRVGFVWDVQNRGEWVVRGGGGLFYGRLDPALFSEAMLYDGGTTVRRGQGTFAGWPSLPTASEAPSQGPALTLFNTTYRLPRTFKSGLTLSRSFEGGLALHLSGAYHHSDFLLRRTDLNRVPSAVGQTQEGRPVYGSLVKQGGLVSPAPGSNRRFVDFDVVSGLSPTGFADYYEFNVQLERRFLDGLSVSASYTFSSTRDNVLGSLSMDPADQLNPFPQGLGGADWSEATSDYDVPHRVVLGGEYRSGGQMPLAIGGRLRYRSGLPFTPGFRRGVDMNGDGSGGNDPAFLDAGINGLHGALAQAACDGGTNVFAARNSCREDAAYGLDLRFALGLPVTAPDGSRLWATAEAFNVVSSEVGVVDRALVLVDRNGSLTVDGQGRVTVPLVANPNFGSLLSRRNDPRLIRVGLRMEF